MSRTRLLSAASLALFLLFPALLFAQYLQWEPATGVPLGARDELLWSGGGMAASENLAAFAWMEEDTVGLKVVAQAYDLATFEPLWGEGGIEFPTGRSYAVAPRVAIDESGDVWIVWVDMTTELTFENAVTHLQRLAPDGTLRPMQNRIEPGIGTGGFEISSVEGGGIVFSLVDSWGHHGPYWFIAPDGSLPYGADGLAFSWEVRASTPLEDGHVLAVWREDGADLPVFKAQKYTLWGSPLWPEERTFLHGWDSYELGLFPDGLGGAFVNLMVQSGDLLWPDLVHINANGDSTWTGSSVGYEGPFGGMAVAPGEVVQLQSGQRLSGSLLQVTEDSVSIAWERWNLQEFEHSTYVQDTAPDGNEGFVVVLKRDSLRVLSRFNGAGDLLWTHDLPESCDSYSMSTSLDVVGGRVLLGTCNPDFEIKRLALRSYNLEDGQEQTVVGGTTVTEAERQPALMWGTVVSSDAAYFIGGRWTPGRAFFDAGVEKLALGDGTTAWPDENRLLFHQLHPFNNAHFVEATTCPVASGEFVTAVSNFNLDLNSHWITLQRWTGEGELLWGEDGLRLYEGSYTLFDPMEFRMLPGTDGDVVVFLEAHPPMETNRIYRVHVNSDGEVTTPDDGQLIGIDTDERNLRLYDAVSVDDGGALVLYRLQDGSSDDQYGIASVDASGELLWQQLLDPGSDDTNFIRNMQLRNGRLLLYGNVAGNDSTANRIMLRTWQLTDRGLTDATAIPLVQAEGYLNLIDVHTEPYHFWMAYRQGGNTRLQRFNYSGEPQGSSDDGVAVPYSWAYLVLDGEGGVYAVGVTRDTEGESNGVGTVHLTPEGEPALPEYGTVGLPIREGAEDVNLMNVVSDGENGLIAVWREVVGRVRIGGVEPWPSQVGFYANRFNDGTVGVAENRALTLPDRITLAPAWPNPFNPSTSLQFTLPRSAHVQLSVFDILGREVTRLADRDFAAGSHRLVWDGHSASGAPAASGLYLVRMKTPHEQRSRRVVLMK